MQEPFFIRQVAVLGAGVMGAQIATYCVNAGIKTLLFDLPAKGEASNDLVNKAIAHLQKLKPPPLASAQTAQFLQARNYEENLNDLTQCDLIIEAIAERLDWKEELYRKICPFLNKQAILVSNTSGLSINKLSEVLPTSLSSRFCGMHFFNPPRYMHLAELIPTKKSDPNLLNYLETWLTSRLGKGVVRANDTPNFIANRIGVFSLLITLHHAETMDLALDEVDALTGTLLGRPKSATFRTMDIVGLDTLVHVVNTMDSQLKEDPWHRYFTLPEWLSNLVKQGSLGQKTGQGIYRKKGKDIEVFDYHSNAYRLAKNKINPKLVSIMQINDPSQRMQQLMAEQDKQAQFLVACYRDLFHYCAYHLAEIAKSTREVDLALRWGFGWQQGPFEIWQEAGFNFIKEYIEKSLAENQTLSQASFPQWLEKIEAFYKEEGAYAPNEASYIPRSELPVYQRQFFPDKVIKESQRQTPTLMENEGVHLWQLQDEVAVLSFKTKANTIGQAVLDGFNLAMDEAEKHCQGLIIYQWDAHNFSSGANLKEISALIKANRFSALEAMVKQFQDVLMRLKYLSIPTIAAVRGRALGGACELMLHCSCVVASFESYPGLVETGVGLIPAGGGCKEMAMRASIQAQEKDLLLFLEPYFQQIARGFVAGSAIEAYQKGYLTLSDTWVMHPDEVLYAALAKIKALQATNYQAPLPLRFKVAGREGHARLQLGLVNWLEGGFISQHDYFIANELASVLCGGELNQGERVNEEWLLHLERQAFMKLAESELTQARILHILETGKPLRN